MRDAEQVRKTLVPSDAYAGRWSIIGQSFGGFCAVSYLSMYPNSLIEVMITGGIPPDVTQRCSADAVYRALYRRVILQVWGRVWGQVWEGGWSLGSRSACQRCATLWSTLLQHQCHYLSTWIPNERACGGFVLLNATCICSPWHHLNTHHSTSLQPTPHSPQSHTFYNPTLVRRTSASTSASPRTSSWCAASSLGCKRSPGAA